MYDEQQMLLGKLNKQKSTEQYVFQFYNSDRYLARKEGLMKGSRDRGEMGQKLVLDALKDPFWHIRQLAIKKVSKLRDERKEEGIAILKKMAKEDPKSSVRSAAVKALNKYLEEEELTALYKDRVSNDESYSVVTASLKNYGKIDAVDAMKMASALESEKSSKMIAGIAELYATNGGPEKYDFLEQAVTGNVVQGFDKLGAMNTFTMFVGKQDDPAIAEKAYSAYEQMGETGGFYMQMFLPQNLEYLSGQFSAKISQLKKEELSHEENGDVALADQSRRKIKSFEDLIEKYSKLKDMQAAEK
jgi:aminopeptidase N